MRLQRNRLKRANLKKGVARRGLQGTRHNLSTYEGAGWTVFNRSVSPAKQTYSEFLIPIPRFGTREAGMDVQLLDSIADVHVAIHAALRQRVFVPEYPLTHVTLTGRYDQTAAQSAYRKESFGSSYQEFDTIDIQATGDARDLVQVQAKEDVVNFMYFFAKKDEDALRRMTEGIIQAYKLPVKLQQVKGSQERQFRFGGTKVSLFSIANPDRKDENEIKLLAYKKAKLRANVERDPPLKRLLSMMTPVLMQQTADGKWTIVEVYRPQLRRQEEAWHDYQRTCKPDEALYRVGGLPHKHLENMRRYADH